MAPKSHASLSSISGSWVHAQQQYANAMQVFKYTFVPACLRSTHGSADPALHFSVSLGIHERPHLHHRKTFPFANVVFADIIAPWHACRQSSAQLSTSSNNNLHVFLACVILEAKTCICNLCATTVVEADICSYCTSFLSLVGASHTCERSGWVLVTPGLIGGGQVEHPKAASSPP